VRAPARVQGRPKGREEKYSLSQLVTHLAAALGTEVPARLLCAFSLRQRQCTVLPATVQPGSNLLLRRSRVPVSICLRPPPASACSQVQFVDDCIGPKVASRVDALQPGQVRCSAAVGMLVTNARLVPVVPTHPAPRCCETCLRRRSCCWRTRASMAQQRRTTTQSLPLRCVLFSSLYPSAGQIELMRVLVPRQFAKRAGAASRLVRACSWPHPRTSS